MRLLNNKQEFGANLLLEVVVMRGDQVLGRRNQKRRRGAGGGGEGGRGAIEMEPGEENEMEGAVGGVMAEAAMEEEGRPQGGQEREEGGGEEDEPPPSQPKRQRRTYGEWNEEELKEEMKSRLYKMGGRGRGRRRWSNS